MVNLKSVQLECCILQSQMCKLCRNLKNPQEDKGSRDWKEHLITSHKYLYKIFFTALCTLC